MITGSRETDVDGLPVARVGDRATCRKARDFCHRRRRSHRSSSSKASRSLDGAPPRLRLHDQHAASRATTWSWGREQTASHFAPLLFGIARHRYALISRPSVWNAWLSGVPAKARHC
ncbi:hypothetical protein [Xanthomonas oryzae]|uniref:hypothetical protein n=1 Tax=Xanthomonas oryzae TaxID=347 RepID=UPI001F51BF80|nr:hypothetical protein [Xanthomonas oryzae]